VLVVPSKIRAILLLFQYFMFDLSPLYVGDVTKYLGEWVVRSDTNSQSETCPW